MLYYFASVALVMIGLYAVAARENLLKKIIGLVILSNGIHLLLISLGYRGSGIAPILQAAGGPLAGVAVDPLPQALVLTSIVINVSILAIAITMTYLLYRKTGTLESNRIRGLKG